jgi:hypothetical protein
MVIGAAAHRLSGYLARQKQLCIHCIAEMLRFIKLRFVILSRHVMHS